MKVICKYIKHNRPKNTKTKRPFPNKRCFALKNNYNLIKQNKKSTNLEQPKSVLFTERCTKKTTPSPLTAYLHQSRHE